MWSSSHLKTVNSILVYKNSSFPQITQIVLLPIFHVSIFDEIPPKYIDLLSHYHFHKFVNSKPLSIYCKLLNLAHSFIISLFVCWRFYFPFKIQMKLCFITRPYLNLLFLMLKLSADFPSPLCSGLRLKSRTAYFILFYEKWTSQIFLVKLSLPTFLILNVMYNDKIPGIKHSH